MAANALFIGWGQVVRGREKRALGLFQETTAYYARLQQEGRIDSFDAMLLGPHGGDLAGFIVLRGDSAKLAEVRFSEDFERLAGRAAAVIDSLGIVLGYTGEALAQQMAMFSDVADEFGG
jgi:hypothetical protein